MSEEVVDVAADGQRRPVAADQHGSDGRIVGDPAGDLERLLPQPHVDGVAGFRAVQADGRHAVDDRVVDRLQRGVVTEGGDPCGAVGQLVKRDNAAVVSETDHVTERRVELVARHPSLTAVVTADMEPAIVEHAVILGLRFDSIVPSDAPPQVALHRLRPDVLAAHVQRQALGRMADEVGMQQPAERVAVARGQRTIKVLGGYYLRAARGFSRHSG